MTELARVSARTQVEAAYAVATGGAETVPLSSSTLAELAVQTSLVPAGTAGNLLSPPVSVPRMGFLDRIAARVECKAAEPKFGIRPSTEADIAAMVDIDMRAFSKVNSIYEAEDEATAAAKRAELTDLFEGRFGMLGGNWMPVVTQQNDEGVDEVVGFMHCCPTKTDPASFQSWEETTNNGKLDTLYDADGKNVYIVTLSMDPKVKGQRGQNSLFLNQIGQGLQHGFDTAFFESRMPGFRNWVKGQCKADGRDIEQLSEGETDAMAAEYFGLKRERNGKEVPYDPLLKVYAGAGCNLEQVVPNAYQDEPSMNYGVLCTFKNPLPEWARRPVVGRALGGVLKLAAKSSWLTRKLFG